MTQALYAHMNNKKIKIGKKRLKLAATYSALRVWLMSERFYRALNSH
jgi:hypothetical protein